MRGNPTAGIADHRALEPLRIRAEFDTERPTRMASELVECDRKSAHRPGKVLDIHVGGLVSRAELTFEPDPVTRKSGARRQIPGKQGALHPC